MIPWLVLVAFYLLTAGTDTTPETTWATFYREMLIAGEVSTDMSPSWSSPALPPSSRNLPYMNCFLKSFRMRYGQMVFFGCCCRSQVEYLAKILSYENLTKILENLG